MLTNLSSINRIKSRNHLRKAAQEFDRPAAILKFITYLNDHHPYLEREEVAELEGKGRSDAGYLVSKDIPQIIDESDTESDSSDGNGSANTTTMYGRQREQIISRLHHWLLYLRSPQFVDGQPRYSYLCPNDARSRLLDYFRLFEIPKDEIKDWLRPIAPAEPL